MPQASPPLPMTPEEVGARGWDAVDVVFVTGDAYVDHPSFAVGMLARVLEAERLRVAVLSQPDWHSVEPWRQFGRPRLAFAVSAGNMDSMINHYTAARKVRNDDAYSPDGQPGRRPDRATLAYCQRCREAYKGVPVIAGGVEASLRRLAHYDYWSDKLRRSILLDAKADLLVYGMGERPLREIVRRLAAEETIDTLRDIRGTAYRLGASEVEALTDGEPGDVAGGDRAGGGGSPHPGPLPKGEKTCRNGPLAKGEGTNGWVELPGWESVQADREAFIEMTRLIQREADPHSGRPLLQRFGREAVVVNPPPLPLEPDEIDRLYALPFTRRAHPSYQGRRIPALETVKDSVQIMRGCFGGCSFCSLSAHQGRIIQSRSQQSVLDELGRIAESPDFRGTISDLGGPSANMYRMNCSRPAVRATCRRASCLHPEICRHLNTDHGPLLRLMKAARDVPGIKRVLIASGVRMDLAERSPEYVEQLARHHTGGLLKVAPEHTETDVLDLMRKPGPACFETFGQSFQQAAEGVGRELHLVPYFMAGHPGCDLHAMIRLAQYMKRHHLRPRQVQEFIPAPMDPATAAFYTGIDPATGREIHVPRGRRERRLQRALLQYFEPENHKDVRLALEEAGRTDLIGDGPECLIPARPPRRRSSGRRRRRRRR